MMFGFPFVPIENVFEVLDFIAETARDKLVELLHCSERIFARGGQVRGRRRAGSPRFAPELWEAYNANYQRGTKNK
jgi:hypothetical protein